MSLSSFVRLSVNGSIATIKPTFKYRTGLEATTDELIGTYTSDEVYASKYKKLLQKIEDMIWFVLITDRIYESLVLLADELKWDLADLLFNNLKVQTLVTREDLLTEHELSSLDLLQPHDSGIYHAANIALNSRIMKHDTDQFAKRVAGFRACQTKLTSHCSLVNNSNDDFCLYFTRDNRAIVQTAWQYKLYPPTNVIQSPPPLCDWNFLSLSSVLTV